LFPLALTDFEQLRQTYNWGANLFYFLSAAYEIHPTYVQEMLEVAGNAPERALSAIQRLRVEQDASSYSRDRLRQAIEPNAVSFTGTWSAAGWAADRTVLIVGSGPWVGNNLPYLRNFIEAHRPVVLNLNTISLLPPDIISAYVACHDVRFLMEADHYRELQAPLIAPVAAFPTEVRAHLDGAAVLDWGLSVEPDRFAFDGSGCVIPRRVAAAYALALANAAGASRILLAGFDGYAANDPQQQEMEYILSAYKATVGAVPLTAVTPTTYAVSQSSIFAPDA
jgi:4-hydroxy 2-oxovalerate aldolase